MNCGIRIIKRDRAGVLPSPPRVQEEKTEQQNDREIAGTVKMWIAELAQRRRADEQSALVVLNKHYEKDPRCFAAIHG